MDAEKGRIGPFWPAAISLFWLSAMAPASETFSIYWENDSRFTKPNGNTDRHYTNGLKLVYATDEVEWQWLRDWSNRHFGGGEEVRTDVGFFFGQEIYTPEHPDAPQRRNPEDMRFAGWLYGGLFAQRATANVLDHAELNVGVIGPSAHGETVQDCIHGLIHSDKALGWEAQLEDEAAVDFSFVRRQRLTEGWLRPREHLDFISEMGFTVGSVHRQAEIGITGRWGLLTPDFGPGRLRLPDGVIDRSDPLSKTLYLFVRLAGRAIEHNRFLSGLTHEPLVGEIQYGLVYRKDNFQIGYSQTYLTQEFKEQEQNDSYGALTLAWIF